MTFCLGITVDEGLVGIADTRVVAGNECLVAKKTATYQGPGFSFFVMHSGLRSARDKILLYFDNYAVSHGATSSASPAPAIASPYSCAALRLARDVAFAWPGASGVFLLTHAASFP